MNKLFTAITSLCFGFAAVAQQHTITVHPGNRVASLQMSAAEFKSWNDNDGFGNNQTRTELTKDIYKKFSDEFDFIFLLSNNTTRPANLTYAGQLISVSNAVTGIGLTPFSMSASYGSAGKLKSVMALTHKNDILNGPSLHELMHNWGNFAINTRSFDPFGPGTGSTDFKPHWGISGCGGQLGGFDQGTLKTTVDGDPNKYSAKIGPFASFGQFANGGNSVPYSNFELYLMGLIPADSISTFIVFRDISAFDGATGVFSATSKIFYNKEKIVTDLGARIPAADVSQKTFKLLVIVLTPTVLTPAEVTAFDSQVEIFAREGSEGTTLYNFWEATGGRARLDVNLANTVGVDEAQVALSGVSVFPNPVSDHLTLSFASATAGEVSCSLTDNVGKKVHEISVPVHNGDNTFSMDLPVLANGIYFLNMQNGGSSITKKVIVGN